ncbi:MAG: AMP-binding protein, partial [Candidatus Lindowbacteria bacterium]|nr:AMP-binding protein [Candidatus Lindowbacteria bacterium]
SVGYALSGTELRISNPDLVTKIGEICIRGSSLMKGYFKNEDATAKKIRDVWLHTGDLGRLARDGILVVPGRLDDLIVTRGGKKSSPERVEEYYKGIPGIKEIAVVGVPSPSGEGSRIGAGVVVEDGFDWGSDVDLVQRRIEEKINLRSKEVPAHLRLEHVRILKDLPKTTTLKVKRNALRSRLQESEGDKATAGKTDAVGIGTERNETVSPEIAELFVGLVPSMARDRKGVAEVQLNSTLQFDLGLDSMAIIELVSRVERRFGLKLSEQEVPSIHKVEDLVRKLAGHEEDSGDKKRTDDFQRQFKESYELEHIPARPGKAVRAFFDTSRMIYRAAWNMEVCGIENLPTEGPVLLCPNHVMSGDGLLVAAALPPRLREDFCCFGREDMLNRFPGNYARHIVKAISVSPHKNILKSLHAGMKALLDKRVLLIHPEGGRTRDGEIQPFKPGAARISMVTGVPMTPVWIEGALDVYPAGQVFPSLFSGGGKRLQLRIHFGKPIYPSKSESDYEEARRLTQLLEESVREMANQ